MSHAAIIKQLTDRFARLAALRESQPVFRDGATGRWFVLRYDDVLRVLTDREHFAPDRPTAAPTLHTVPADQPAPLEARHALPRTLPAHTASALSARITATIQQRLAHLRPIGRMDVIDDLAVPLVATVFTELLGIASEQQPQIRHCIDRVIWADMTLSGRLLPHGDAAAQRAMRELAGALLPLVIARRGQPHGDLISQLLSAEAERAPASNDEVADRCRAILAVGAATMTRLLGNAALCLTAHPAVIEQLRHTPPPVYSTIEEILRYLPPVWYVASTTTTELMLGDQRIPAHAEVWASLAAANHDPAQFDDPERFNIERIPNRHLSFGPHRQPLMDAGLARQLTSTLLLQLAALPDLHALPCHAAELAESAMLLGIKHLPVIWDAGQVVL